MDPGKYYERSDSSAWGGDSELAAISGAIVGLLASGGAEGKAIRFTVGLPNGYAPVIELTIPSGRRFRVTVAAVPDDVAAPS